MTPWIVLAVAASLLAVLLLRYAPRRRPRADAAAEAARTSFLAHMMGGTIRVASEPGKGSTFTLRLPRGPSPGSFPGGTGESGAPSS